MWADKRLAAGEAVGLRDRSRRAALPTLSRIAGPDRVFGSCRLIVSAKLSFSLHPFVD